MYLNIANQIIKIRPLYSYIEEYCQGYLMDEGLIEDSQVLDASVTLEDIQFERDQDTENGQCTYAYLETLAVYRKIAESLIEQNILLFHASIVEKDGKGVAFTAPSGTGKSTHSSLWKKGLHAKIINDDKPLVRIEDNCVYAYGTPWNGKHRRGCNERCQLTSICILQRDENNSIEKITSDEIYPYLLQQIYRPTNPNQYLKTLKLIQTLLKNVSVYRLKCNMDLQAATIAWEGMK